MEVYKITNKVNNKIYIGITIQGVNTRWYKHCYEANYGSNTALHNAIRKYGKSNFIIDIIENISETADYDQLKEREIFWIDFYDSTNREIGYNLTLGGDGTFGFKMSEETKDKIKEKALGRKATEETKEKFRNRQNVNKIVLQCSLDGEPIAEFKSCAEASRCLDINKDVISACARGIRKRAYGYTWVYICDAE